MYIGNRLKISCIILWFFIASCSGDRLDVDLSNTPQPKITVLRMDKDFFAIDTNQFSKSQQAMIEKYREFYFNFLANIVNLGGSSDSIQVMIKNFIADKDIYNSYQEVQKQYTEEKIKKIETDLSTSFRYFNYHFPKAKTPKKFISFISGFNYNITPQDSVLGFGLEMYLGENCKFYEMLQWPKYKTRQMSSEYLVSDCMKGWIMFSFEENEPVTNLLSYMIRMGKIYYAMDAVLREVPDSIKIGYTQEQMTYCEKYEKNVWAFFVQKERLFKTDMKELADYSSEGPFTAAISKDCPPRIASWIGWQIVRSYMEKNDKVSLEELMNEKDNNRILNMSKYKP